MESRLPLDKVTLKDLIALSIAEVPVAATGAAMGPGTAVAATGAAVTCSYYYPLAVGTKADLLIDKDNPDLLMPLDVRRYRCEVREPYATLTRLGWVLQGPIEERMGDESSMKVNHVMMDQLSDQVDKLWDIERQDESVYSCSVEDKQVHDIWQAETVHEDGRYTVPIPWRPGRPSFPNNRFMAMKRLDCTVKRLNQRGMTRSYGDSIRKLLDDV